MIAPGFTLRGRPIGTGAPMLVVGEVAQAHDGSLGTAHKYVEAIARAGGGAAKFQTHIAEAESSPAEPWRVRFSPQDETRYDYWKRMEFTEAAWRGLVEKCEASGVLFLSSAFSIEAVRLLASLGIPAWKVGAGEITNLPMITEMARTKRPVLLSSGMSKWAELDAAVELVRHHGAPVAVLQCTSHYPTPPDKVGLNVLGELRARYECPVGLSDHSGTIFPALAAAVLGAAIVEVHVVFSRECFGPDVTSSVTTAELAELVRGVRFIETAMTNAVDKERMADELGEMRRIFGKSVVPLRDLPKGHVIAREDLGARKPAHGIPASEIDSVVSRRLKRSVSAGAPLTEDDLD